MEWINVKDRLPDEFEKVLLCTTTKIFANIAVGYHGKTQDGTISWYACGRGNTFICNSGGNSTESVTHWMPLPEPPKGE